MIRTIGNLAEGGAAGHSLAARTVGGQPKIAPCILDNGHSVMLPRNPLTSRRVTFNLLLVPAVSRDDAARPMVADAWLASYHEIGYGHGYLQNPVMQALRPKTLSADERDRYGALFAQPMKPIAKARRRRFA